MADSKVKSAPSLVEARKAMKRASKRVKNTAKARRLTRKQKAARAAARRAKKMRGMKRAAVAPKGKEWLAAPVQIRKIQPLPPLGGRLPTAQPVTVAPLRPGFKRAAPVAGEWNGVELIPVISSNVASYGYDPERELLLIAFLDGSLYRYFNVPEVVWIRFQAASSKGKFVWSDVRDQYEYQRVA